MEILKCSGESKYGDGVQINLTGNEVAIAIDAYLAAHSVHISGARTIRVNGKPIQYGGIYVDPSAYVVANGIGYYGGRTDEIIFTPEQIDECIEHLYYQRHMISVSEVKDNEAELSKNIINHKINILRTYKKPNMEQTEVLPDGKYLRPKTRGELLDALKQTIKCEVVATNEEITSICLDGWLKFEGKYKTRPSENTGWVIYEANV